MKKFFCLIIFCISFNFITFSQVNNPNLIVDKRAHSIQLMKNGTEDRYPIISLDGEQLKLSFDMLGAEAENYQYTIVHCDADWKSSKFT